MVMRQTPQQGETMGAVFYSESRRSMSDKYERRVTGHVTLNDAGQAIISDDLLGLLRPDMRVREPGTGQFITPEDGERFIRALPILYRGTHVWAELTSADFTTVKSLWV